MPKLEVVAGDHDAAQAAFEQIKASFRSARDAGLYLVEFYDLARYSANPASPPYEVIELKGQ